MHTCLSMYMYMFYTQLFVCFVIQQGQKIVVLFAWMKTWKKISCFPVIVGENLVLYIQVVFRNWWALWSITGCCVSISFITRSVSHCWHLLTVPNTQAAKFAIKRYNSIFICILIIKYTFCSIKLNHLVFGWFYQYRLCEDGKYIILFHKCKYMYNYCRLWIQGIILCVIIALSFVTIYFASVYIQPTAARFFVVCIVIVTDLIIFQ